MKSKIGKLYKLFDRPNDEPAEIIMLIEIQESTLDEGLFKFTFLNKNGKIIETCGFDQDPSYCYINLREIK